MSEKHDPKLPEVTGGQSKDGLETTRRPKPRIQPFQVWMLIALVIAVAAFGVAVVGPRKVLCAVEGGHYTASSDTCFIPRER